MAGIWRAVVKCSSLPAELQALASIQHMQRYERGLRQPLTVTCCHFATDHAAAAAAVGPGMSRHCCLAFDAMQVLPVVAQQQLYRPAPQAALK